MLKEYKKLPWPRNLLSVVFQGEVAEDELPEDWELALNRVFETLEEKRAGGILQYYFRDNLTMHEIGKKLGLSRESIRQKMGHAIETMRRPGRQIFLVHGYSGGQRLLDQKRADAFLADNEPVDILNLSARARNCLRHENIETIGQLRCCSEKSLSRMKNMGKKTVEEIKSQLSLFPDEHDLPRYYTPEAYKEQNVQERLVEFLVQLNKKEHLICNKCGREQVESACEKVANHMISSGTTVARRGKWEEVPMPEDFKKNRGQIIRRCSECGWTNTCRYNYCPHCGARMDLED